MSTSPTIARSQPTESRRPRRIAHIVGFVLGAMFCLFLLLIMVGMVFANWERLGQGELVVIPLQVIGTLLCIGSYGFAVAGRRKVSVAGSVAMVGCFVAAAVIAIAIEGGRGDWYGPVLFQAFIGLLAVASALCMSAVLESVGKVPRQATDIAFGPRLVFGRDSIAPEHVRQAIIVLRRKKLASIVLILLECIGFIILITISAPSLMILVVIHLPLVVILLTAARAIGYSFRACVVICILLFIPIPIFPLVTSVWLCIAIGRFTNAINAPMPTPEPAS